MMAPHTQWLVDLVARLRDQHVRRIYLPAFRFDAFARDLPPTLYAMARNDDGSLTMWGVRVVKR